MTIKILKSEELTDPIKEQMAMLLTACFQNTPSSFPSDFYILSFTKEGVLQALCSIQIQKNDNFIQHKLYDVCSSTYGKVTGAIKELLTTYFEYTKDQVNEIQLDVDMYNSYWDQVINLYVSFGFVPTGTTENLVHMSRSEQTTNKKQIIDALNKIRVNYFTDDTYVAGNYLWITEQLQTILSQLMNRPREYSGIFSFLLDNWSGIHISSLSTGNLTFVDIYDHPTQCTLEDTGQIHFHTHPPIVGNIISPPSNGDITTLFIKFTENNFCKHYVFTQDGIFSLSFSIRAIKELNRIGKEYHGAISGEIIPLYSQAVSKLTTLLYDPLRMLGGKTITDVSLDPNIQNNILIEYFIEEVLKIKYPSKPFSMFDIKFWSLSLLSKLTHINEFIFMNKNLVQNEQCEKPNTISFPLTSQQVAILDALDREELAFTRQVCEQNNLIIPFSEKDTQKILWQYCNPYSYQNVGKLLSSIKTNQQYIDIMSLISKQVPWENLMQVFENKEDIITLARTSNYDQILVAQHQDFRASDYIKQSQLITQSKILTSLASSLSAYDISQIYNPPLGEGTFGIVSRALSVTGETVAVKQFKDKLRNDAVVEIGTFAILRATGSKYTPNTYGLSYVNGNPSISIELFKGSLELFMKKADIRLDLPIIMDHTRAGLAELHKCKIIHCDIKPANILMRDNQAFIGDFGLCQVYPAQHKQGTPFYYSPELKSADGVNTFASDIWALGITLIDACMGSYNYSERKEIILQGKIPQQVNNVFDAERVKVLKSMISSFPKDRKYLKASILPVPSDTTLDTIPINWNIKVSSRVKKQAKSILERYCERTLEPATEYLLNACVNISLRWHREPLIKDIPDDKYLQWKIIVELNGLIYIP